MAIIKIQRKNEWMNRFRKYRIFIDKKQVGTLANGEVKDFEVADGARTVVAKMDWCRSRELIVNPLPGEPVVLQTGSFKHSNWLVFIATTVLVLHFLLMLSLKSYVLSIPAIIILLFIFLRMSLGWRNYLSLEEIKN